MLPYKSAVYELHEVYYEEIEWSGPVTLYKDLYTKLEDFGASEINCLCRTGIDHS